MTRRGNASGALNGVRALLGREDWIYLLSLLVPLMLYDVVLKVARVVALPGMPGVVEFVDQLRSEVFFNLGYALLWIGLFAVARRGIARLVVLGLFHLSAMAVAAVATSAHFFYKATGSVLDYDLIAFSLSNWRETHAVIMTETTTLHWLLLSVVLFYAVAGPAVLTSFLGGRMHVPLATPGGTDTRGFPVAVCVAALVLGVLSLLPSFTGSNKSFARAPVANMIVAEFAEGGAEGPNPEIETELAAEDLPTDATLAQTQYTAKRNVVMVFLESTRASATTPYDADLDTTPFLAELAKNSLLVENAYAVVPHTSKALVAGHCGVVPPLDTENTEAEPDAIPARCIPDLLKEQGYATAFFQSATETFERRRMLVENLGHEDFFPLETLPREGFSQVNYFGYEDDVMLEPSKDWLQEQKEAGRPFMASYLTVTVHHDYVVPEGFETKDYGVEDDELNRYLNTVAYQDQFLENLIAQYKELGLYEDTIFVIMGDHGEGFGEHGRRQHDNTIYEEGLRIPMLIHDPKRFAGGVRVKGPANQLDLLPTLAGLLGYDITGGTYPGDPLYALSDGRPVMASCYHEEKCLASIVGDEKFVYHFDNQDEEFFDLSEDPQERQNIADAQPPEEIERRREELLAWRWKVNAIYERQLELVVPGETTGGMEE